MLSLLSLAPRRAIVTVATPGLRRHAASQFVESACKLPDEARLYSLVGPFWVAACP